MTDSIIVKIRGLKKYYGSKDTLVRALNGIDLDIEQGTFTAIVGASGSGKFHPAPSSIGGTGHALQKGTVIVSGRDLSKLSREESAHFPQEKYWHCFSKL